jgi:D-alanine-D-alanine ligase
LRTRDPAAFGRVAVLMGGTTSEREGVAGLRRQRARGAARARRRRGRGGRHSALLAALSQQSFDRVFNILHGGDGENGVLQGLLEALGVPYTGSGVLGSALSMDKIRTKQVWMSLGCPRRPIAAWPRARTCAPRRGRSACR